ncbi:DUF397 domain-containing protein [Amycolatopsis sp. NPDC059657]|uniref:DUF397 domain-containing protein n=1 Tax=Amycolatopsis sp. NPDC059657 TaxID=3346899 RepID=UPI003672C638
MVSDELVWIKSSHSGGAVNDCVEVAFPRDGGARVRDSKDPDGGDFELSGPGWLGLLAALDDCRH